VSKSYFHVTPRHVVERLSGLGAPPDPEIQKTQLIRLADVFFIGPVMIHGGRRLAKHEEPVLGGILALLGIATIVYNGKNWIKQNRIDSGGK